MAILGIVLNSCTNVYLIIVMCNSIVLQTIFHCRLILKVIVYIVHCSTIVELKIVNMDLPISFNICFGREIRK